jgi:hypothetical protein
VTLLESAFVQSDDTAHQPRPGDSWQPVNLAAVLASGYEPPAPTVCRVDRSVHALFYEGRINAVFGDSGGGKSWLMAHSIREVIESGRDAVLVDYEDHPGAQVARLEQIGLNRDLILRHLVYLNPTEKWTPVAEKHLAVALAGRDVALAVIDSTGEGMAIDGVSPNADEEVARWFRGCARYLAHAGAAVVLVDHVVKSRDSARNADFASGSQRKRAAVNGAAYHLEVVVAPSRENDGKILLHVRKDRFGRRKHGSTACEVLMLNHADDDGVDIVVRAVAEASTFKPTGYMGKVSTFLAEQDGAVTMSAIKAGVTGKGEWVGQAVQCLIDGGFAAAELGARGSRLVKHLKLYSETETPLPPGAPF